MVLNQLHIMAYRIIFEDFRSTNLLTAEAVNEKELLIAILNPETEVNVSVSVDRRDAIKLAKEIRKQISFLEVNNG